MLTVNELREIARERIKDAEALYAAQRYEGAMYICGYAIEIALKACICKTLHWPDFPETNKEFNVNEKYKPFKIHTLELLLSYSGREDKLRSKFFTEWSLVSTWDPQSRYTRVAKPPKGTKQIFLRTQASKARDMIDSAKILLREL